MKKNRGQSETGIALFMVISAVALMSVLMAEFTYSTQINARLAYNYVDNLKAYYLAKAAFKLSLARLKAYAQVKQFMSNPANKQAAAAMGKSMVEQIWTTPLVFPLNVPKEASMIETDAIKKFAQDSKLEGKYTAGIFGESTKLNLNGLLLKSLPVDTSTGSTPPPPPSGASPAPTATPQPMRFREALEPAISTALERKKDSDREFADVYRNVNGKDVVDAIASYLLPDFAGGSNLPGFTPIKTKGAPMYSLSELHLIPGIDDELFDVLHPLLTVYATPGINVNRVTKETLLNLVPEMTNEEVEEIIRRRDDVDVGKPFNNETEFWGAIEATSAGRSITEIKERWKNAGLKPIFDEQSFKIGVEAVVGQAIRRLEAYVIYDPKATVQPKQQSQSQPGAPSGVNVAGQPSASQPAPQDGASSKKPSGLTLVYWRMM